MVGPTRRYLPSIWTIAGRIKWLVERVLTGPIGFDEPKFCDISLATFISSKSTTGMECEIAEGLVLSTNKGLCVPVCV